MGALIYNEEAKLFLLHFWSETLLQKSAYPHDVWYS